MKKIYEVVGFFIGGFIVFTIIIVVLSLLLKWTLFLTDLIA